MSPTYTVAGAAGNSWRKHGAGGIAGSTTSFDIAPPRRMMPHNGGTSDGRGAEERVLNRNSILAPAVAVGGVIMVCVGTAIAAYRRQHGDGAVHIVSVSDVGMVVVWCGVAAVATGVLVALTIALLGRPADSAAVIRRGLVVVAAWMAVVASGAGAITYMAVAGTTIGDHGNVGAGSSSGAARGAVGPIVLRGTIAGNGAPVSGSPVGARVIRNGLVASCQWTIPNASVGEYEITVLSDADARGCGAAGAEIVLYTTVNGQFVYSHERAPWPSTSDATFNATFSTSDAQGAGPIITELAGEVANRDGSPVARGTVVEVRAGDTVCAVASVGARQGETGYNLDVAGPQVPGCAEGAALTFRIGGQAAAETAVNDLGHGEQYHKLDLRVR